MAANIPPSHGKNGAQERANSLKNNATIASIGVLLTAFGLVAFSETTKTVDAAQQPRVAAARPVSAPVDVVPQGPAPIPGSSRAQSGTSPLPLASPPAAVNAPSPPAQVQQAPVQTAPRQTAPVRRPRTRMS